jgi:hypothetical protein
MKNFRTLKKFAVIILTGVSTIFLSCSNESLQLIPDEKLSSVINEEQQLNNFAKTLAIAMKKEPELRAFLKAEVLKKVDGTYSVLYNIIRFKTMSNGKSVESVILQYADNKNNIISLSNSMLNLNIKVPIFKVANAVTWNENTYSPSVSVNPEGQETSVNTYDENGVLSKRSTQIEPTDVVVLVERNQYVKINSLETINDDIKESLKNVFFANQIQNHNDGYKPVSSDGKVVEGFSSGVHNPYFLTAEQKEATRLYLGDIYIPSNTWQYASDNWAENELNINVRIYAIVGDSKTLDVSEKELLIPRYFINIISTGDGRYRTITETTENRWVDFKGNLGIRPDIGFWDRTKQGNAWKIEFLERDPGNQKFEETITHSSEFSVGIKLTDTITKALTGGFDASYKGTQTGTTKKTYDNTDDKLAQSTVYISDNIRQEYSTGLIKFTLSAKNGNGNCGWNWTTNSDCDD